jgi:two-component system sensor histidine kinase/response regulator
VYNNLHMAYLAITLADTRFVVVVNFIATAIALIVGWFFWKRRHEEEWAVPAVLLALSTAVWAFSQGMELSAPTFPQKVFWGKSAFLGIVWISPAWFVLALQRSDWRHLLTRRLLFALSLVPLLTLALAFTNEWHHLIWSSVQVTADAPFPSLQVTFGLWMWLYILYAFILQIICLFILITNYRRAPRIYRRQNSIMLLVYLIPFAPAIIRLTGFAYLIPLEVTPLTLTISLVIAAFFVLNTQMFHVTPLARQTILSQLDIGVLALDAQNRIIEINPVALSILGLSGTECVGQRIENVSSAPLLAQTLAEETAAGEAEVTINGTTRYYNVSTTPWQDAKGRLNGRFITFTNVTRRKKAEIQLRQLSRAVEQSDSSIVITNLDGNIEFVNPAFTRVTGYTPDEVMGKNPRVLKSGRLPDTLYRELWQTITQGSVWQGELLNRKKDGSLYWENAIISPVKDDDGVTTHYLAIKNDITRQKEALDAQEQLLKEMTALNTVFQKLSRATDLPAALQMTTRALVELFDTFQCSITLLNESKDSLIVAAQYSTRPNSPTFIGATIPIEGNVYTQQVIKTKKPVYVSNAQNNPLIALETRRLLQQAGVHSHMILPLLARGELIGTIGVDTDRPEREFTPNDIRLAEMVTGQIASIIANTRLLDEREEAVRAAEAASKAKSVFLANMSHELRTPLNAILGFAQLLQYDANLTPPQQENLATIHRSGQHLLTLINDILEMSRIEAGQVDVHPSDFDLHQLLTDVTAMLTVKAEEKGLALTLEQAPDLPRYIHTDESKLRQILINLTGNAIKFTDAGSVKLSAQREAGGVHADANFRTAEQIYTLRFSVTDTGIGLSPEQQKKIFNPFAQVGENRRRQQGAGLGLAISHHFAALLGGELRVESELGVGSTFTFNIQAAAADETAPSADLRPVTGVAPGQPAYRILIVEDNEVNLRLLQNALKSVGLPARGAADAHSGIRLVHSWRPHLVLMDVTLPGMDGLEATQRIKAESPDTPVIVLTARAFAEDKKAAFSAGCDAFMTKPVDITALFHEIGRLTGVQFIQETATDEPAPQAVPLSPERLAGLSPEMRRKLYEAAVTADRRRVTQLLAQIREEDEPLASALNELAQSFQFGKLVDLVEAAGS